MLSSGSCGIFAPRFSRTVGVALPSGYAEKTEQHGFCSELRRPQSRAGRRVRRPSWRRGPRFRRIAAAV